MRKGTELIIRVHFLNALGLGGDRNPQKTEKPRHSYVMTEDLGH